MSLLLDAHEDSELEAFARFCLSLRLESGRPMELEPFQRRLLADYFDGVRETLVLISKKNGKTTLLAALALFHLCSRPDAECVIGATSREQASILFLQAAGFVKRADWLQRRVVVKGGYREIRHRALGGRVRVLAADVDTADGVIPTLALVDELHRAKSSALYGVFRDGLGPRQGQMVTISVAGEHEASPLGQIRLAAFRLPSLRRDGRYTYARAADNSFVLHEWSLDNGDDLADMQLVKQVNPASWQTEELLAQRHDSPSTVPWQWARMACGVWTGADAWWLRAEDWHALASPDVIDQGDRITLGFDGSRYGDSTALVACRLSDGLLVPLAVWEAPNSAAEWEVPAEAVDAAMYSAFEDYRVVRAYFDPPLWQTEIDGWARQFGAPVMRYPTNRTRFMQAVERFRTDVVGGSVRHDDNPTLTAHVLNAHVREARGGYWIEKGGSGQHIDCAIAAVLAYEARADARAAGVPDRSAYAFV